MAQETAGTRVRRDFRFDPEGTDDGQLPVSFRLACWSQPQKRDGRIASGWAADGPPEIAVLAEGLSRRTVEAIIAEGAAALSWDGKD